MMLNVPGYRSTNDPDDPANAKQTLTWLSFGGVANKYLPLFAFQAPTVFNFLRNPKRCHSQS